MEPGHPSSLVYVQASELFPKKILTTDDSALQVPFPELCGESVEYLSATANATLAISSYRLFICLKDNFINLPLHLIESLEIRDLFSLHLNCKDARSFRIVFDSSEQCIKWYQRLSAVTGTISQLEDLFSFTFHAWCLDAKPSLHVDCTALCQREGAMLYSFMSEYQRMGFDTSAQAWRITDINSNFEVCSTYPKLHIVPALTKDEELEKVADFRTSQRFPSIVWRHMTNGAVIARCSQPKLSWFGWRSKEDEALLQAVGVACSMSDKRESGDNVKEKIKTTTGESDGVALQNDTDNDVTCERDHGDTVGQVLIVDARSYTAAVANRAKGGGCECSEYYPNCEVQFMNLANIHTIRKSFQSLRNLCSGPTDLSNWWSSVEKTNWLDHISLLLKATLTVVTAVHKECRPVVVHCSDGWDRTAQVVALAELMLDPYYRTIEGFQVLIEREWLDFGHRFADRCGHGFDADDNQRCPVFLQWLDCVHQLTRQFPCSFEFNEAFLLKLVQHTYSCLFGTFLCNSEKERLTANIKTRTSSVWTLFRANRMEFRNLLYSPGVDQVLQPTSHVRSLQLWSAVYLAYPTPYCEVGSQPSEATVHKGNLPVNYSDSNLELKHSDCSLRLSASRSDGELVVAASRCSQCKECDNRRETTRVFNHVSSHLKLHACTGRSQSDSTEPETHSTVENGKSMYYSTADPCTDSIISLADSTTENMGSLTSSTTTVVLESNEDNGAGAERTAVSLSPHADSESGVCSNEEDGKRDVEDESLKMRTQISDEGQEDLTSSERGEDEGELSKNSAEGEMTSSSDKKTLGDCDNTPREVEDSGGQTEFNSDTECPGAVSSEGNCSTDVERTPSSCTLKPSSSQLLTKYVDIDGLTRVVDVVHERLRRMECEHQLHLNSLRNQLLEERRKRLVCDHCNASSPSKTSDLADEVFSLPDSSISGDQPASVSSTEESTWIQVEEKDAQPTLWVPDHVATNCANCDARFWIANRKHHCRNCGRVFCNSCSQQNLPVPDEQLYDPVRVCLACFEKLVSLQERENGGHTNTEVFRS